MNVLQDGEDTRPLVHFNLSDATVEKSVAEKRDGGVATTNGRLANREAAEMLKKKKAKRDSNSVTLRIEIRTPTFEAATMNDDTDTISEAISDNKNFLETSL